MLYVFMITLQPIYLSISIAIISKKKRKKRGEYLIYFANLSLTKMYMHIHTYNNVC